MTEWGAALGQRVLRLIPAFGRSLDQIPLHATAWAAANELAHKGMGPLWVVLGDSTAQAIGIAAGIEHGYVGRTRTLLEQRDGREWRVVNLARSGAVLADVLSTQLPTLRRLADPALITCIVGGNDLRRTPLPSLLQDVRAVFAALPSGAAVATMPRGLKEKKARPANLLIRQLAAERGFPIVDLWAATGPPWRGKYADGLHPNPAGITDWVAEIARALDLPPEVDPPSVTPKRRGLR